MTSTVLEHLKDATRQSHNQLEQHPLLQRLRDPRLSTTEYAAILCVLYGFYAPIETKLGCMPEWEQYDFSFEERRKSPLLRHDLRALGQRLPPPSSRCSDLPLLTSFGAAAGCLYVLEGATLGGQIIARDVQRHLELHPMRGIAFFSGYGPATGTMWRAFGDFLTTYAASLPNDAAIVAGANATFRAFERWLNTATHVVFQE